MASEYLLNSTNPKYRFILSGLTGGGVNGTLMDDISIGLGNSYSSSREAIQNAAGALPFGSQVARAMDIKDSLSSLVALSGRSRLTQIETRKVWDGSNIPQFQIQFFYLSTSVVESDSPIEKIKRMQSAVLPTGVVDGGFLRAPLGYTLSGSGTLTLSVGEWLRIPRLVMTDFAFTASKEVMRDGRPLTYSGSFTLEPFQAITYADLLGYYRV